MHNVANLSIGNNCRITTVNILIICIKNTAEHITVLIDIIIGLRSHKQFGSRNILCQKKKTGRDCGITSKRPKR